MHNANDVATLTAQLVEAMAAVRSLQQQNQAMGEEMRDMRAQMHEERLESTTQAEGLKCTPHPWTVAPQAAAGAGAGGGS